MKSRNHPAFQSGFRKQNAIQKREKKMVSLARHHPWYFLKYHKSEAYFRLPEFGFDLQHP
jgi:hypothetical protein